MERAGESVVRHGAAVVLHVVVGPGLLAVAMVHGRIGLRALHPLRLQRAPQIRKLMTPMVRGGTHTLSTLTGGARGEERGWVGVKVRLG